MEATGKCSATGPRYGDQAGIQWSTVLPDAQCFSTGSYLEMLHLYKGVDVHCGRY